MKWRRRDVLNAAIALGLGPNLSYSESEKMLTRPIPGTDESIPVVGLGTWEVFDVAGSAEEIATRKEIIDELLAKGGSVIDSSPMYRRSEMIVGDIIEAGNIRDHLFLATKVWTDGKSAGESQMQKSIDLMNAGVIDLMQVHNLRDVDVHMATIREWQAAGRIRYSGITHYTARAHRSVESAMQEYKPQFMQINYSLGEREAEQRLLPLAQDLGISVLINRPFMEGRLFSAVRNRQLPDWATEFAQSLGAIFPQVHYQPSRRHLCDSGDQQPHHMADNLGAGFGTLPDAATRRKMADFWGSI